MLRQRVLTAVVLMGLLLGSLFSGVEILFPLLSGAFVFIAAWEWAGLSSCRNTLPRMLYSLFVILPLPFLYASLQEPWSIGVIWTGTFWWCAAAVMVIRYQCGRNPVPTSLILGFLTGCFVLIPAWTSLVRLYPRQDGPGFLLLLFVMIWIADSAAYFAGRRWGRRRLASRVSPAKSWEGVLAGLLVSFLPVTVYVVILEVPVIVAMWLLALSVITTGFSVVGDLFESMCKRMANVKDSSQLLPGHGGVMDRIDSITAAAPVFATGVWLLEGRL